MSSLSFSSKIAAVPHSVPREVSDLRADVEEAFITMEAQVEMPTSAQSTLRLNVLPTATDTVVVGADVYEFVAAVGDQTGSHIGVKIAASGVLSLANLIAAINGTSASTVASSHGTVHVKASVYNTDYLKIEPTSDTPGGTVLTGPGPSLALSETLTDTATWDQANLSQTGWGGTMKRCVLRVVVTAANLAADFDLSVPFTPYTATCILVTSSAGVPSAAKAANTVPALVQARNAITVDLNGGGGTDPVATDIVYIEVIGF